MISYCNNSIFHLNVDAISIPVNCVGVAGAGLALQAKKFISGWYDYYKNICLNNDDDVVKQLARNPYKTTKGNVGVMRIFLESMYSKKVLEEPIYIYNIPTKNHWKEKSDLVLIKNALLELKEDINNHRIKSIGLPALGCGLGGLDWSKVKLLIEKIFKYDQTDVFVCEPMI